MLPDSSTPCESAAARMIYRASLGFKRSAYCHRGMKDGSASTDISGYLEMSARDAIAYSRVVEAIQLAVARARVSADSSSISAPMSATVAG